VRRGASNNNWNYAVIAFGQAVIVLMSIAEFAVEIGFDMNRRAKQPLYNVDLVFPLEPIKLDLVFVRRNADSDGDEVSIDGAIPPRVASNAAIMLEATAAYYLGGTNWRSRDWRTDPEASTQTGGRAHLEERLLIERPGILIR